MRACRHHPLASRSLPCVLFALAAVCCAGSVLGAAAHPDPAQGYEEWESFVTELEKEAANGASAYRYELNRSGGASVFVRIVKDRSVLLAQLGFSERSGSLFVKRLAGIAGHVRLHSAQKGGLFPRG